MSLLVLPLARSITIQAPTSPQRSPAEAIAWLAHVDERVSADIAASLKR